MGSISSKRSGGSKAAVNEGRNPPSISVINCDPPNPPAQIVSNLDEASEAEFVGGGNMTVHSEELKRVIEEGRREIKETQEKLNSSLTTPIVEAEAKVIQNGF